MTAFLAARGGTFTLFAAGAMTGALIGAFTGTFTGALVPVGNFVVAGAIFGGAFLGAAAAGAVAFFFTGKGNIYRMMRGHKGIKNHMD